VAVAGPVAQEVDSEDGGGARERVGKKRAEKGGGRMNKEREGRQEE